MVKKLCIVILFCAPIFMSAQNASETIHNNYRTFGVNLHSNGWGMNYSKFFPSKIGTSSIISFDYMNQNYAGERKANDQTLKGNPIVINKINNLYYLKAGFGKSLSLSPRENKSSLGVSLLFNAGPMVAAYKPIYILYSLSDTSLQQIIISRYDPAIHQARQIDSKARFWESANKSSLHFGMHARTSVRFDWGSYESNFKALEAGITLQYINSAKPLIYSLPAKSIYTSFYIMLTFGKITD